MNAAPTRTRGISRLEAMSSGAIVMIALALISGAVLAFAPQREKKPVQFWTFARMHTLMYAPLIEQWNQERPEGVDMTLFSWVALERRMMSAFMSQTAVADLIEVERAIAGRAFAGPLDAVGFVDLTDRLKSEGLYDQVNAPSFSPWTSRGRIFGLPHDVHPVLLVYRADIVEAAGIDLSTVETWSDFFTAMRPVMADTNNDNSPDRFILSLWDSHADAIECLLLQSGGRYFDDHARPEINSAHNAHVVATLVSWMSGPDAVTYDAMPFTASGNRLKVDGYVVADLMPDWMCNIWKNEMPQLAGKLKVMQLPAWEKGGRRTSVWGGTMLGITKATQNFDAAWEVAKHLYTSDQLARELYKTGDIITPFRAHWTDPVFAEPDPYFCNQQKGLLFIEQAPNVPLRPSSPYNTLARDSVRDAVSSLATYSRSNKVYDATSLLPEARRLLDIAQQRVANELDRNQFLREGS